MSLAGKAVFAIIILSVVFWAACNDAFRPIATVIPAPGPDPAPLSRAFVLSNNGPDIGAVTAIDVPGDTIATVQYVGHQPVHLAMLTGGGRAYTSNRGDDTVTALTPGNLSVQPATIPLPGGAQPQFAFTTQVDFVWEVESPLGKVAQVSITQNILTREINVGTNPVALAEPPNGQKLYVVNQGSNDVTIIQTADGTVLNTMGVGNSPVWAVASSDGQFVFVANQGSSTVTVIDTTNDAAPLATIPIGGSPSFIMYDSGLRRVYTANPASNSVSILRADQALPAVPTLLATVDVSAAPCNGSAPVQVSALPDGSRAYVANSGSNNVCVISALSNTITKSIPVGTAPISIGASSSGTRVYTANSGSSDISIILTSQDAPLLDANSMPVRLPAPKKDPNCNDPAAPAPPVCPRMNPAFVVAR